MGPRFASPSRWDRQGERLLLPHVLPGGKAILFTTVISDLWDAARIVVQPLDAGTPANAPRRDLITGGADARYVDSGHLVYMKSGTLMAVPFDVASQQVTGAPVALIENVMQAVNAPNFGDETGAGQFAVSASGTLLYALGGIGPIRQSSLVWVDRTGAVTPLAAVPPAPQLQPRLSPDGRKLAVNVRRGASRVTDVWVFDVARGAPTRLTLAMESHGAVWSPDSRRVAFVSSAGGVGNKVFVANADGSGQPERLTDIQGNQTASTWAATGNAIAFMNRAPGGPLGIWVLPMDGTPRTPRKFLEPGVYSLRSGVLTRRHVDGVRVQRIRTARGLRAAVPRSRRENQDLDERRLRTDLDQERPRDPVSLQHARRGAPPLLRRDPLVVAVPVRPASPVVQGEAGRVRQHHADSRLGCDRRRSAIPDEQAHRLDRQAGDGDARRAQLDRVTMPVAAFARAS